MRYILGLLILFSTAANAQKLIGRESFMVNVRPVLNGILGDFYQMVGNFPDFPRELGPLIQELNTLAGDKEILRTTCPRVINIKCKDTVDALRIKLQRVKSLSFLLLSRQKMASTLHLNTISGTRVVSDFDTEVEEIKGILDNTSFLLTASLPQKRETFAILKELDELNTKLSLALVEYIPFMYKEDFRQFFFNFINPIQQHISKSNNYEFIHRNITSLNFSLNLLNQTLTKKKKTPEGMGSYLAVMHNRWNSLLRYYY